MWIERALPALFAVSALYAAELPQVGVMVSFPESLTQSVRTELQREADRILSEAGLTLEWQPLEHVRPGQTFDRIVVVRVVSAADTGSSARSNRSLGLTHVSNGRVLPFVEIEMGRVAQALLGYRGHDRALVPSAFGRSLGRVAAHEIFHVLAAAEFHDDDGVMKPAFSRSDLLAPSFNLTGKSVQFLRRALGPGQTPASTEATASMAPIPRNEPKGSS